VRLNLGPNITLRLLGGSASHARGSGGLLGGLHAESHFRHLLGFTVVLGFLGLSSGGPWRALPSARSLQASSSYFMMCSVSSGWYR
jgi:hypothetical protein